MGIPIHQFVAATNANDVVPAYLETGHFEARPSVATISNAMDVGDPSNLERIRWLFGEDMAAMRQEIRGSSWTDEETSACIRDIWDRHGVVIDPHTAVGLLGLRDFQKGHPGQPGVVLSTAHPAKFAETVEPLVGHEIQLPTALARRLDGERQVISIPADFASLRGLLRRL
jgi:threonine synthase